MSGVSFSGRPRHVAGLGVAQDFFKDARVFARREPVGSLSKKLGRVFALTSFSAMSVRYDASLLARSFFGSPV